MKIPLVAVGSTPPRSMRGKTFLPESILSPALVWGGRLLVVVTMGVIAPVSWLVALWWMWGLRQRLWRWYVGAVGVVSAVAALAVAVAVTVVAPFSTGLAFWGWVGESANAPAALTGALHPGLHVSGMLAAGWAVGTVVGCYASFLHWWRTPSWRDRERPMTLWAKHKRTQLVNAIESGAGDVPGVVTFGVDTDTGEPVELPWSDTDGHILVVGAPGSGKTTTSMRVVRAAIRDGLFTAVVDMKGSPKMIDQVAEWCTRFGRPLWVFSADGPSRYDPFKYGDYNRKRDLLMATSVWTEAHYQAKASDYLLTVFYVLDIIGVGNRSWLHTVADMLNPNILQRAVATLPNNDPRTPEAKARVARVLDEVLTDPRSMSGLGPRVRALTDTVMGQWVQPGEPEIDLHAIWEQNGVVMFSLPSLTYPEAAASFGGLAVQDLKTLAGELQERGNDQPGIVFVDEFATLGAHNVTSALAMSRESGLRWMLATQDLGDLAVGEDGRAFVQKVLTDTNVKVIHAVGDPETAKRLSELAGSKWGVKERASINMANSSIDTSTATQMGTGYVDRLLMPAIEPNDVLHQGSGETSTFTLINKPGMYAITAARTIRDLAKVNAEPTAPQYLPGKVAMSGMHAAPSAAVSMPADVPFMMEPPPVNMTPPPPEDEDGWWG